VPWACGWGQGQGTQTPRVETLGYEWEEVVSASHCSGKRTEVRGRGAPVPHGWDLTKEVVSIIKKRIAISPMVVLSTSELRMVKVNLEYEGGVSLLARFGNKPNRLVESQSKYWFLLEWI